jgi:hypothetical protein
LKLVARSLELWLRSDDRARDEKARCIVRMKMGDGNRTPLNARTEEEGEMVE